MCTAQITIATDPLPQIIDGVPTALRSIYAVIDRAGFVFNPTSCNPSSVTGTPAPGSGGVDTSASVESRFQVGGCQSLKFAPKFSVSTPAKTSKKLGAGLSVKLAYPTAAQGTQANIAMVKVDLPKQLPSRLKTLQEACVAAVFEANPPSCPAHSIVGHATAHTPELPVPLVGPAYFVSHGGEAFPALTVVLQGDGVTIDLVGSTFIKNGITSNTFKSVPDAPVSSCAQPDADPSRCLNLVSNTGPPRMATDPCSYDGSRSRSARPLRRLLLAAAPPRRTWRSA